MPENRRMMNKLKLLLFLIAALTSLQVKSQEAKGFAYYDSLTFSLYKSGNWKALEVASAEALRSGLDFYYLRARMGVALYNTKNYRTSVTHFEKAQAFNSDDPFVLEYLYYAYLESGRSADATKLASEHKGIITAVPGAKGNLVKSFFVEGGITPDAAPRLTTSELVGADRIYGETDIYNQQSYFHAGINLQLLPATMVYASASALNLNKQHRFAFPVYNNQGQSSIKDTTVDYQFLQREFYVAASFVPGSGITINPAFHSMSGNPTLTYSIAAGNSYSIGEYEYPFNHYVFSLSGTKDLGHFTFGINGSYAKLTSTGNQKQVGTSITWYPFGNLNLYATTALTGFFQGNNKRLIVDQSIGGRILPEVWLEGTFTGGDLSYYNEKNAYVVYNLTETINYRLGANLIYTLSPHIDLSLMYRFYERENEYFNYSLNTETMEVTLISNKIKYQNYSIFGGLKWKF